MRISMKRAILFYAVMVCLLFPIGYLAIWAAKNARPNFVSSWPTIDGQRHFVIGYNNFSNRFNQFYCTDLESGATSVRVFKPMLRTLRISTTGTKAWLFGEKSKDQFVVQIAELNSDQPPEVIGITTGSRREMENGIFVVSDHLMSLRSGTLESSDVSSGSVVDKISLPIDEPYHLELVPNTNSALVVSAPNSKTGVREVVLFEVIDGQIQQLAGWSDLHCLNKRIGDQSYVLSLLADGQTIEVRDTSTGKVVSKYPVPQDPLLPTTMSSLDFSYLNCCLRWRVSPLLHTDILTGQTLPIPVGSELLDLDNVGNRLITIRKKVTESLGFDCIVLDKTSGKELIRFDVALGHYHFGSTLGGAFLDGANRLVLTTQDHRLFLYDLTSGQLVRNFDTFFWPEWCQQCVILTYAVWCLAWLFVSAKYHPHGWLDFVFCSGLVVAFYTALYYSDYMVCVGIFASWTHLAMTWLIFGKTRWSLRFQPLLLLAGTTTGIMHLLPLESDDKTLPLFISGLFLLMFIFLLAMMPLRWLRFRLETDRTPERAMNSVSKQESAAFALRDLFLLTIVFAFLFSILRWLPALSWNQLGTRVWILPVILSGWTASVSLFAMWVAFSRRSWKLRLTVLLIVAISFATLAPGRITSYTPFVATLFGFYAYRLRGWRLKNKKHTHDFSRSLQ